VKAQHSVYYALVHKEPGSAFGLSFPDLPGCFSATDDEADIVTAAQEALSLYADDKTALAPPSPLETLRALPQVQLELLEGAAILAVPMPAATGTSFSKAMTAKSKPTWKTAVKALKTRSSSAEKSVAASALGQTKSKSVTSATVAAKAANKKSAAKKAGAKS